MTACSPSAREHRGDNATRICSNRKRRKRRVRFGRLTPAQQELATQFLPLARGMAKPLKLLYPCWRDEFESASCLGLVEAARAFDPDKNVRFATFARFRIRGALMDVGRTMLLTRRDEDETTIGTVTLTPYTEEHGRVLVAVEPPAVGLDVDDIDQVEHWFRKLPDRHAEVCRMYYIYGKTQAEIAEAFGCSQSEITRLHRKSIDLLKEPYGPPAPEKSALSRNCGSQTSGSSKPESGNYLPSNN